MCLVRYRFDFLSFLFIYFVVTSMGFFPVIPFMRLFFPRTLFVLVLMVYILDFATQLLCFLLYVHVAGLRLICSDAAVLCFLCLKYVPCKPFHFYVLS